MVRQRAVIKTDESKYHNTHENSLPQKQNKLFFADSLEYPKFLFYKHQKAYLIFAKSVENHTRDSSFTIEQIIS